MTLEGLPMLEEALAKARVQGDEREQGQAALRLGRMLVQTGRWAQAREALREAAAALVRPEERADALEVSLLAASVRLEQGYMAEAETLAEAISGPQSPAIVGLALALQGAAQLHQGRSAEGLMLLDQASSVAAGALSEPWARQIGYMAAGARLVLGLWDEAIALASACGAPPGDKAARPPGDKAAPSGDGPWAQRAGLVCAEAAIQQGDFARAEALLAPLYEAAPVDVQLRSRLLWAQMALGAGQAAGAGDTLAGVKPLLPELDAPRLESELLLLEAEVAQARGESGLSLAEAAAKLFDETRQQHQLVRALGILARLGPDAERAGRLTRARDLAQALARPLGELAPRYLAAYGRGALEPPAAPPPMEAPTSITELRDLVRRLEEGLSQIERQGGAVGAPGAPEAPMELGQVVGFARAVNSTLDLPTVLSRAAALTLEATNGQQGVIMVKEPGDIYSHHYQAARSYRDDLWGGEQFCREIAQEVTLSGQTAIVAEAQGDVRRMDQASVYALDPQVILAVPLKDQNTVIGALCVTRRGDEGAFNAREIEIAQAFASLIAQAILNATLLKAQEERRVHLEMLNRLYRTISRTLELSKVLDLIAEMTLEVTKAERAFILLWESETLSFGAGRDREGPLPPTSGREVSNTACQKVVETQQGVYVFDTGSDAEFNSKQSVVALKLGSIVAVPLMGQSGLIGVLYIDSKTQSLAALERELSVLTAIANIASLSVENARLYRQATVDGLTGLYARSFFLHRMDEEIRRTNRYGGQFTLLVMDIDHFKKFNDLHGHQTGDSVIKLVARTIRESIREGLDLPGRYGGEELVLMLPETDTEGAFILAERIRERVANAVQLSTAGEALRVTISIGVATYPNMATTAVELFEKADQALYASKHAGRNKTTVYDEAVVADA